MFVDDKQPYLFSLALARVHPFYTYLMLIPSARTMTKPLITLGIAGGTGAGKVILILMTQYRCESAVSWCDRELWLASRQQFDR